MKSPVSVYSRWLQNPSMAKDTIELTVAEEIIWMILESVSSLFSLFRNAKKLARKPYRTTIKTTFLVILRHVTTHLPMEHNNLYISP